MNLFKKTMNSTLHHNKICWQVLRASLKDEPNGTEKIEKLITQITLLGPKKAFDNCTFLHNLGRQATEIIHSAMAHIEYISGAFEEEYMQSAEYKTK